MKLEDLVGRNTKSETQDVCRLHEVREIPPRPVLRFPHGGYRDVGLSESARHVIVVENDEGLAEYKILYPDGHLGAVED